MCGLGIPGHALLGSGILNSYGGSVMSDKQKRKIKSLKKELKDLKSQMRKLKLASAVKKSKAAKAPASTPKAPTPLSPALSAAKPDKPAEASRTEGKTLAARIGGGH